MLLSNETPPYNPNSQRVQLLDLKLVILLLHPANLEAKVHLQILHNLHL